MATERAETSVTSPAETPAAAGRRLPWATLALLAVNLAVYAVLSNLDDSEAHELLRQAVKQDERIDSGEYWRLITPVFLHFDAGHLLINLLGIWIFGARLEGVIGSFKLAVVALVSGFAGVVAGYAFHDHPSGGASGMVLGLVGAYIACRRFNPVATPRPGTTDTVLLTLLILLMGREASRPSMTDSWAHGGGLIGGVLTGASLAPLMADGRWWRGRWLARVMLAVFLGLSFWKGQRWMKWLHEGNTLLAEGNLQGAWDQFSKTRRKRPWSPAPLIGLGRTAVAMGRLEDAAEALEEAQNLDPDNALVTDLFSEVLRRLGDVERATTVLEECLVRGPHAQLRLISLYLLMDRPARAFEELASTNTFGLPEVDSLLAECQRRLGRPLEYAEALARYESRLRLHLQLDPRDPATNADLAWVLIRTGREPEAARDLLMSALERDPQIALPWLRLGILELHRKEHGAALAAFEKALACGSDVIDGTVAHYLAAWTAPLASRGATAAAHLEAAHRSDPEGFLEKEARRRLEIHPLP